MTAVIDHSDVDVLGVWAASKTQRVRLFGRMVEAGLRFAFYGRVVTEDYQDPVVVPAVAIPTSRLNVSRGGGRILAEFFELG